ncbi:hypothetical protein C1646_769792 [Rhizophagus diaphanus]|nr:hypothetical protein C1646_769792 [Rhizophagus diaphanus] [Rhizophagus sp. MUCL 43196]
MINDNTLTHIELSNISPERYFKVLTLIPADELFLQELVDYLQTYFIENRLEWIEQHFKLTSPEKIFKSLDFTSLPEKNIDFTDEVWDVKMGFAQHRL